MSPIFLSIAMIPSLGAELQSMARLSNYYSSKAAYLLLLKVVGGNLAPDRTPPVPCSNKIYGRLDIVPCSNKIYGGLDIVHTLEFRFQSFELLETPFYHHK